MSTPYYYDLHPYSPASVAAAAYPPSSPVGQHPPKKDGELEEHFISVNGRQIIRAHEDDGHGTPTATISVYDTSFLRGDGVFEVMKVIFVKEEEEQQQQQRSTPDDTDTRIGIIHRPKVRCLERHLERLQTSAGQVQCPLPPLDVLRKWIDEAISCKHVNYHRYGPDGGAAVRLMFTKGNSTQRIPPSTVISIFRLPEWPDSFTLCPVKAPWHPAGAWGKDDWSVPIKWTSYGPNVVSTTKAKSYGYTDALLVSPHRLVPSVSTIANNKSEHEHEHENENENGSSWKNSVPITEWHVLDGPNFAIGFIEYTTVVGGGQQSSGGTTERGGSSTTTTTTSTPPKAEKEAEATLHLPSNEQLGLLPSITQKIVEKLARTKLNLKITKGIYKLETLLTKADELFVTSTTRGIKCVTSVGNGTSNRNRNHHLGGGGGSNNNDNDNDNDNNDVFPTWFAAQRQKKSWWKKEAEKLGTNTNTKGDTTEGRKERNEVN